MFEDLNDEARHAVELARQSARTHGSAILDDVHLLIGCCRVAHSLAARVLLACGQDPVEVCARAEGRAASLPRAAEPAEQLAFSPAAKAALERALEEAEQLGHTRLGTHHVLLGVLRGKSPTAATLTAAGLALADVRKAVLAVQAEVKAEPEPAPPKPSPQTSFADSRAATLRAAQRICADLERYDLATQLRDLARELETAR